MDKIRCAVVGLGYWGPKLARNVDASRSMALAALCDSSAEPLERAASRYPGARMTREYADIVDDSSIDAVFIATPVSTHHALAMAALRGGKHVLVEKPLCMTRDEAAELVREADRCARVLMVDHVFVFTPAVRRIRELIGEGAIGNVYYYDSVRVNLGLFQHDVNVISDLAVHDLAIMDYVISERPVAVSAVAAANLDGRQENVAYVSCFFESGLIAHVNVNWLAPVKIRHTLIGGSKQMILYDDLEPDEKIKIYDRGVGQADSSDPMVQFDYRLGDMWAPRLDRTEALAHVVDHFADCIRSQSAPITDGRCGLRVVELVEAARRSAEMKGRPVELQRR